MAKKKSRAKGANKSDVIREILKQQPKAPLADVRTALKARGVTASDALVNKIKYGRNRNGAAKRSRRAANGQSHGNKAEAIRGAWGELGRGARPRDVIALVASRGIKVSSAQVSSLRKSAGSKRGLAAAPRSVPFDHLMAAKGFSERLGGIEPARKALTSLATLIGR